VAALVKIIIPEEDEDEYLNQPMEVAALADSPLEQW
jgi:hypothetical protein